MAGFRSTSAILALFAAASIAPAFAQTPAQTPAKALAASQPAHSAPASGGPADSRPRLANSWVCASGIRLEVYPVSFDTPTDTPQYVLVFKQNNQVISSQRIDPAKVKDIPAYACDDRDDPKAKARPELLG